MNSYLYVESYMMGKMEVIGEGGEELGGAGVGTIAGGTMAGVGCINHSIYLHGSLIYE